MRQIAVKDSDSHSWFTVCNQYLHKYNLPNIYILQQQFSSEVSCKQEIKAQVDSFVAELWCSEAKIKTALHRNTFLSSPHLCFIIVFICDLFVSRDDPLMS